MDLNEIKEYTHPIRKLNIYNTNKYSLRKKIILKVDPQPNPDETVRFSLDKNDNFIEHQQRDKDFFIRVPNYYVGSGYDTNTTDNGNTAITTIYVHYFPKDLYEYKGIFKCFSEFDLYKIANMNQKQQSYQIHFKNYKTNEEITNEQMKTKIQEINNATTITEKKELEDEAKQFKPIIQSLFTDGTVKNPNYKNYTYERGYYQGSLLNLVEGNDYSGMTEQGEFPLSSHYRTKNMLYVQHPNLKDATPSWDYDLSFSSYPYWEVKIHRDELSPLISDGVENTDEDTPLNVFLNYNYLQTSTSYHQHFFGFEDSLEYNDKYYNILEGENINKLDQNFGNSNNYRIIQLSNPFNDKYSIKVPKGKQIPLNLDEIIKDGWSKNICEDYYICTQNNSLQFSNIEKDRLYSLKYYIYIPSKCNTQNDSCYISVNNQKISEDFLYKDKALRNEWIYHEIPFIGEDINTINIIPSDDHEKIYFYNIYIEEMPQYSPTIKYSNRGIAILEEDQAIMRPLVNTVEPIPIQNDTTIDVKWDNKNKKMPTPYSSVHFIMDQEDIILYDQYTTNLTAYGERIRTDSNNKPLIIQYKSNSDFTIEDEEITDNDYEGISNNTIITKCFNISMDNSSNINIESKNELKFVQGTNNNFNISLINDENLPVNTGHIKCAIYDQDRFILKCDNLSTPRGKCLDPGDKYHEPDNNGIVYYNHIDLSQLGLNTGNKDKQYFLKITYINECYNGEEIEDIKPFVLQKELYQVTPMTRGRIINENYNFDNNDLPLQIQAKITNQMNQIITVGYCELFIDEKLTQSTIVDTNGIADFYLDLEDLKAGQQQQIKIIYYKKWDTVSGVVAFNVNNRCSILPAIPIKIQALSYTQNNEDTTLGYENEYLYTNTIYVNKGSPVFIDIDTSEHNNFKLEIQAPNISDNATKIIKTKTDESIIYCNHLTNGIQRDETYYIITKSLDDNDPKYRENKVPVYFEVID